VIVAVYKVLYVRGASGRNETVEPVQTTLPEIGPPEESTRKLIVLRVSLAIVWLNTALIIAFTGTLTAFTRGLSWETVRFWGLSSPPPPPPPQPTNSSIVIKQINKDVFFMVISFLPSMNALLRTLTL
jgi:hypothetical protein